VNFCPRCGTPLAARPDGGRPRQACPAAGCGFIHYGEHSIGTGAVVVRGERVLLIERRTADRVWWQIPGGFVEADEAIDACFLTRAEIEQRPGVSAMSLWAARKVWDATTARGFHREPEIPGLQRPGHTLFGRA
jgi:8-oxo-dGTP pyrophosphatase MutT (NUDIX family)